MNRAIEYLQQKQKGACSYNKLHCSVPTMCTVLCLVHTCVTSLYALKLTGTKVKLTRSWLDCSDTIKRSPFCLISSDLKNQASPVRSNLHYFQIVEDVQSLFVQASSLCIQHLTRCLPSSTPLLLLVPLFCTFLYSTPPSSLPLFFHLSYSVLIPFHLYPLFSFPFSSPFTQPGKLLILPLNETQS